MRIRVAAPNASGVTRVTLVADSQDVGIAADLTPDEIAVLAKRIADVVEQQVRGHDRAEARSEDRS